MSSTGINSFARQAFGCPESSPCPSPWVDDDVFLEGVNDDVLDQLPAHHHSRSSDSAGARVGRLWQCRRGGRTSSPDPKAKRTVAMQICDWPRIASRSRAASPSARPAALGWLAAIRGARVVTVLSGLVGAWPHAANSDDNAATATTPTTSELCQALWLRDWTCGTSGHLVRIASCRLIPDSLAEAGATPCFDEKHRHSQRCMVGHWASVADNAALRSPGCASAAGDGYHGRRNWLRLWRRRGNRRCWRLALAGRCWWRLAAATGRREFGHSTTSVSL